MSPEDKPNAPASSAASTSRTIAARSGSDAGVASGPITAPRTVPCPTRNATFSPSDSAATASRYASNVRQRATSWFGSQGELDELLPGIGDRRERVPAIARQLGREPLPEVTDQRAIDEQRAIRVPVRIDESRRDHESPGIDHLRHIARVDHRKVVDGEDAVSEDTDVGATPGRSRPIHDGPAAHEEVEGGHALMMTPRTGASPDGLRRASILRRGCPNTRLTGRPPTLCYNPPSVGL